MANAILHRKPKVTIDQPHRRHALIHAAASVCMCIVRLSTYYLLYYVLHNYGRSVHRTGTWHRFLNNRNFLFHQPTLLSFSITRCRHEGQDVTIQTPHSCLFSLHAVGIEPGVTIQTPHSCLFPLHAVDMRARCNDTNSTLLSFSITRCRHEGQV